MHSQKKVSENSSNFMMVILVPIIIIFETNSNFPKQEHKCTKRQFFKKITRFELYDTAGLDANSHQEKIRSITKNCPIITRCTQY